jgi:hypothetical protein
MHDASVVNGKGPDGRNPMARLIVLLGGYQGYYNSYSTACYNSALPYITAAAGNSSDAVLNSKLVVLFGDNSLVRTDDRFEQRRIAFPNGINGCHGASPIFESASGIRKN